MVFSSVLFLFAFLPVTLAGYYLLPRRFRNVFLLLASLVFYGSDTPKFLLVLLASILVNYTGGLLVRRGGTGKKAWLVLCLAVNLGLLFYYKYFDFAMENLDRIFGLHLPLAQVALPIGISFFTFKGMSYVIDVYRGDVEANRNLPQMALYISLFPELLAGPISKYKDLAPQLTGRRENLPQFTEGVERFVMGLSKKVLLADVLGVVVDRVFGMFQRGVDTPTAWLALLCYTLQIYFDFSGYSDMAIGLGKMLGFDFMENFNYPYLSKSITEFWRRWHISLSSWFRDYLYIPLGGNRKGAGRTYLNLLIVFCATGLWHGANWQFLLWGLWHGLFLLLEKRLQQTAWYGKVPAALRWAGTMVVVALGWMLFRAAGVQSAWQYLQTLLGFPVKDFAPFTFSFYWDPRIALALGIGLVAATPLGHLAFERIKGHPVAVASKRLILLALFLLCTVYIMNGSYSPFIYFRF